MTFDVADGVRAVQCIEMAMKKHSDVFEKRKAIILAVYKQDVAEHRRRCLAMKLQTETNWAMCTRLWNKWPTLGKSKWCS